MSNVDVRARCSMPDSDVTFACMRLSLLRRFVKLGIPWVIAVVSQTARLANGWASMVAKDWAWIRIFGDPTLPDFQDSDGI